MRKLLTWMLSCLCIPWCYGNTLDALKLQMVNSHQTKVIFTFDKPVKYRRFMLANPTRMVFDFFDIDKNKPLPAIRPSTQLVKSIRLAHRAPNQLRVVLDLSAELKSLPERSMVGDQSTISLTLTSAKVASSSYSKGRRKQVTVKPVPYLMRDVVVMIDPGHGGKDPGASGSLGHLEKNVVLSIARLLKMKIDKQPGMKAFLTRHSDRYVPLRSRLKISRQHNADVFISIHADAFHNRSSHGVSVFALSQRGATSEAARWLAAKENYSELGGVNLAELDDSSGMVRSVLIDLSQTATIASSIKLGTYVLDHLDDIARLHHQGVEQARFVVLKSPDIPSILIETGFISNRKEERRLTSRWYQKKLVAKIFNGLKQYFIDTPPRNSLFAYGLKFYKVKSGDTLSGIASRYHLSVAQLKKTNKLATSKIRVGQKLQLPNV